MNKPVLHILNIFKLPTSKMVKLRTNLDLLFEDGVIIKDCYYKDIIAFRYFLDFRNKLIFDVTSDLWITNHTTNGFFNSGSYLDIYSSIYERLVRRHIDDTGNNDIMLPFFKVLYETIDLVNREFLLNIIEYGVGAEITEMLDIQFDDELISSIITASKSHTRKSVDDTYTALDNVIKSGRHTDNIMVLFYLSGVVSVGQLQQVFGSRGFITDLNSKIYARPMTNSLTLGFKDMYEATIESRTGTKALFNTVKSIQNTEYTARGLQLGSMFLNGVTLADCGNTNYIDFLVRDKEYGSDGEVTYTGDLTGLIGKSYFDTNTGIEKVIRKGDTHLINTTIRLRDATMCQLGDKRNICSKCLGDLALTLINGQNLGHLANTLITAMLSQSLLGGKHLLMSAVAIAIKLTGDVKKILMIKNSYNVHFKANILKKKLKRVHIRIRQSEAFGLTNVDHITDIFNININKVSKLTSVTILIGENETVLPLKSGTRSGHLSRELILYIKENGYMVPDEEHFLIDVNDFNNKFPVIVFDKVEFDYAALGKEFTTLIKKQTYRSVNGQMRSENTPGVLVQTIYELLNNKLSVNYALIEIMITSLMANDINNLDFDLGRNSEHRDLIRLSDAIDKRSVGSAYGWDNLQGKIHDPMMFIAKGKVGHPLDVLFKPNEVVNGNRHQ